MRVLHQRAGDRGTLLLPARQGRGTLKRIVVYTNLSKRIEPGLHFAGLENAEQAAPFRHARQHSHEHIGDHWQAADQVELLEYESDVCTYTAHIAGQTSVALHRAAVDEDLARTGIARDETGHMAQQRRFARARCAQQRNHFTRGDLQRDIVKRLAVRAERLAQSADFDCMRHVDSFLE